MAEYENLVVHPAYADHVALVQLNRPKALNALSQPLMQELQQALQTLDENEAVRVIVLTGNEQAFAAGADIKQMVEKSPVDMLQEDQFSTWDQIYRTKKPIVGAVSGFALGGGCELSMTCDMIVASETARFGQPEIKIGVMPGAGGTQRLVRAVGKARAMEMVLTGDMIKAEEARDYGLINKVVPKEVYLDEGLKLAKTIAQYSPVALQLAKDSVKEAFETDLQEGLRYERKNFYTLFASADQKEGMTAFIEKRNPVFQGK